MKKFLYYATMPREWPKTAKGWRANGFVWAENHRDAVGKSCAGRIIEFDDDQITADGGLFYVYIAEDTPDNLHPNGMPIAVREYTMIFKAESVRVNPEYRA